MEKFKVQLGMPVTISSTDESDHGKILKNILERALRSGEVNEVDLQIQLERNKDSILNYLLDDVHDNEFPLGSIRFEKTSVVDDNHVLKVDALLVSKEEFTVLGFTGETNAIVFRDYPTDYKKAKKYQIMNTEEYQLLEPLRSRSSVSFV